MITKEERYYEEQVGLLNNFSHQKRLAIGIVSSNSHRVNGFDPDQANHIGMGGEMMYKAACIKTGADMDRTVCVRAEYKAGSQGSSKKKKDIVMEVLAGKVEDVQEHASGSYTETSARVRKNSSCLLEFGHMNWPTLTKSHRRSNAVEKGALFLVLFSFPIPVQIGRSP